jgi:hypothetical protein
VGSRRVRNGAVVASLNDGTLQGFGGIQGNLFNCGSVVLPGEMGTAGVLTVTSNYSEAVSMNVGHVEN